MKTSECFARYDELLHQLATKLPYRDFSDGQSKEEVIRLVRKSLGIHDEWIPGISAKIVKSIKKSSFTTHLIKAQSWDGVAGVANLYVPDAASSNNKCPFILIACGHGAAGKLSDGYQTMAATLAMQGAVVLVADNIGQGERGAMGHRDCPAVFACGLSVQGLIVMETIAWLNWAKKLDYVDTSFIGAAGNSGGGTLSLFLGALYPDLAALCPTGYPCSFEYIMRKEKRHCDCNMIPGCLGKYEMWDVLCCFAPKPMLITQGVQDDLIPVDIFYSTARKVKDIYEQQGAGKNFRAQPLPGQHSWDAGRINLIANFFAETFGLKSPVEVSASNLLSEDEKVFQEWPEDAMTTTQLATSLTGKEQSADISFEQVFRPRFMPEKPIVTSFRSCEPQRIFAQFEAFIG